MSGAELKAAFREKAGRSVAVQIEGVGTVYVRRLKLKDQRELRKRDGEDDQTYAARLAACVLTDENGDAIFDVNDPADMKILLDTDLEDLTAITAVNTPPGN